MTTLTAILGRVASFIPLILLSLGLDIVVIVGVLRPTAERLAMVERIGSAITNLGLAASGVVAHGDDRPLR
jgi:hypothetical protein